MKETYPERSSASETGNICINCALCCDGSIFSQGRIGIHDDMSFLKQMGVGFGEDDSKSFFFLPCKGLNDKHCTLYHDKRRYKVCREFRCKLLKRYIANEISYDSAVAVISNVITRKQSIKALCEELQLPIDKTILDLIVALQQSGRLDDPSFRRAYPKQLLDCIVLHELIRQHFHNKSENREVAD